MIIIRLKGAEPRIAPGPTVEGWMKVLDTTEKNSGPLQPAAIRVAPATSSGMPVRSQRTLSEGTRNSSQVTAIM